MEIHFGSSPVLETDSDRDEIEKMKSRFFNLKARMFQHLADDLRDHLDIFESKDYLRELPMLKSKVDSKSKIRIESKDDWKKRTGLASPDKSDSLALANLGRYVNINYGSFVDLKNSINKKTKKDISSRKKRISPREY